MDEHILEDDAQYGTHHFPTLDKIHTRACCKPLEAASNKTQIWFTVMKPEANPPEGALMGTISSPLHSLRMRNPLVVSLQITHTHIVSSSSYSFANFMFFMESLPTSSELCWNYEKCVVI